MASKNTKKRTTSRQKNLSGLNVRRLAGKSLFVLIAMAWAFILGVLVGKGYRPENTIPEIARIMPEKENASVKKPGVLKAEELEYYDRLKKKAPPTSGKLAPKPKTSRPNKQAVQQKQTQQRAQAKAGPKTQAQKAHATKQQQAEQKSVQQQAGHKALKDEQRFTYVYQVAAFRSQADAMRLQQKIIGLGIPAFLEDSGSGWHRVHVRFKGTPAQLRDMKTQLASLGLRKPMLKSRKPL